MSERYTLTQPKTKNDQATYFYILERMYRGEQISNYITFNMTTQALRENGLCKAENREGYVITDKGRVYVDYVRSTNKPSKKILRAILNSGKEVNVKNAKNLFEAIAEVR